MKFLHFFKIDFAVNQGQNAGVELKSTQEIGKPKFLVFSCYFIDLYSFIKNSMEYKSLMVFRNNYFYI